MEKSSWAERELRSKRGNPVYKYNVFGIFFEFYLLDCHATRLRQGFGEAARNDNGSQ